LFKRRRAALLAAALYALYPPIAWDTVDPYNDIWAVDFTITIVAIYLEVLDSPHRWRWLIACGVLSGVAVYFRPNLLLIAPALALATVFRTGWREALRRGATIALIGALILLPWTVRNYEDFHAFIPTNSSMWEVMWGGLGEFPNDFGASLKTSVTKEEVRRVRPDLRFESPAWDAYLEPWVVHAIEHHPLFYLKTLAYRVAIATVWAHDQLWMHRGSPPVFTYKGGLLALIFERPLAVAQYMLQPLAFLLAMLALGFTWRGRRAHHLILIATVLAVLVPYIAISVESRYLLPAAFAYFIWIGLGADLLMQGIQARSASVPTAAPRRTWTAVR
jgi:4-amino-4-deoxy-L-arabinose transferase-like glycosyltransferase